VDDLGLPGHRDKDELVEDHDRLLSVDQEVRESIAEQKYPHRHTDDGYPPQSTTVNLPIEVRSAATLDESFDNPIYNTIRLHEPRDRDEDRADGQARQRLTSD
jgi:hypothetical protein